jgi:Trk K+ transport system NAD-binding subunit
MAEVSLIPDSELIGKTVREIAFRTRLISISSAEARWQSDGWRGDR